MDPGRRQAFVETGEAALRREDSIVFVIRLLDGEEVHAADNDTLFRQ